MQTRTSFPLPLCLEYIQIGGTFHCIETQADYDITAGAIGAALVERKRQAAFSEEVNNQAYRKYQAFTVRTGVAAVSVEQIRVAAFNQSRLTALDNAITTLPISEFKVRWQCMGDFTRADLEFLVPGTLTTGQANALFTAAQAVV